MEIFFFANDICVWSLPHYIATHYIALEDLEYS